MSVLEEVLESGLVPAVRAESAERALAIALAIEAGGIRTLEIPLTVPGALDVIARLRRERSSLIVGAGTVLDEASARMAMLAGAQFIVTPALTTAVIACCRRYSVPVLCGALTPTEIVTAWQAGADVIKVFPASAMGGPSYIKSLKAPLPQVNLMPMGGVSLETAAAYVEAGACALGVGADLTLVNKDNPEDFSHISSRAAEYVAVVRAAKQMR